MLQIMKKYHTAIYAIIIICLTGLFSWYGFTVFNPSVIRDTLAQTIVYEKATVLEIIEEQVQADPYVEGAKIGYQVVRIALEDGTEYVVKNPISRQYNLYVEPGDDIISLIQSTEGEVVTVTIHSFNRSPILLVLALLFIAAIVMVGNLKGLRSLIALAFTGSLIFGVFIPALFAGQSPIMWSVIICAISTFVTMTLINGWQLKTWMTIIATIFGVCLAGIISYLAGELSHLSGATLLDSENLFYIAEQSGLQVRGLMFATILIASLGAVMDVAMSIVSSMEQFVVLNKQLSLKTLFMSGMEVGKDIIGTMSNTLILAFVGSSLTSLILLMAMELPLVVLINNDFVATELIQSFAGSIGIIATVPVSAALASYLFKKIATE
ncbi:MAG: YibE/F family protein [Culicoidibacterales bacterium]